MAAYDMKALAFIQLNPLRNKLGNYDQAYRGVAAGM
jgi:hypothetical protein